MKFTITLPTYLTIIRMISPFLMLYYVLKIPDDCELIILSIFIFASLTDYFDGFLARRSKSISKLGVILDPIADKILLCSTILILSHLDSIPLIPSVIIIFREFFISGIRQAVVKYSINSLEVSKVAKIKTAIQFFSISLLCGNQELSNIIGYNTYKIGEYLIWIAAIFTLYTGIKYCINGYEELKKKNDI